MTGAAAALPSAASVNMPNRWAGPSSTGRSWTSDRPAARWTATGRTLGQGERHQWAAGLREPGDDQIERRFRRHGLLFEESLLPLDLGRVDVGKGEPSGPVGRSSSLDGSGRALVWPESGRRVGSRVAPGPRRSPRRRLLRERRPTPRSSLSGSGPSALPLAADPPLDGELTPEGREGRLLAEERLARETGIPQHQVVHGFASAELADAQGRPEPEPDNGNPRSAQGAGVVDGGPDVSEPLRNEAVIGPGPDRVPRGGVVEPERGPASGGQAAAQVPQRPRGIGRLQSHARAHDGDTGARGDCQGDRATRTAVCPATRSTAGRTPRPPPETLRRQITRSGTRHVPLPPAEPAQHHRREPRHCRQI